jgi:hypothetical protein
LKDLGSLKGLEIQIEFTSDTLVFWRPYKYNDKSWKVSDSIKDPKVVGGLISRTMCMKICINYYDAYQRRTCLAIGLKDKCMGIINLWINKLDFYSHTLSCCVSTELFESKPTCWLHIFPWANLLSNHPWEHYIDGCHFYAHFKGGKLCDNQCFVHTGLWHAHHLSNHLFNNEYQNTLHIQSPLSWTSLLTIWTLLLENEWDLTTHSNVK